jgi:hypothetical protein
LNTDATASATARAVLPGARRERVAVQAFDGADREGRDPDRGSEDDAGGELDPERTHRIRG